MSRIKEAKAKGNLFKDEPYYVSYRRGKTINLGNYESEKIEIGLSAPCTEADRGKVLKMITEEVNKALIQAIGVMEK